MSGLHSSKSASNVVADRELRASVDAMAAVNTAGMSRQELVAYNKNLKVTIHHLLKFIHQFDDQQIQS